MMVRIGDKAYILGKNSIWEIDLNNFKSRKVSSYNWEGVRCAVTYNNCIYGFFESGLYRLDTIDFFEKKISSENWKASMFKCAVNFGKHCYVHYENAIFHVDLTNGSFSKINSEGWGGSKGVIPISTSFGFTEVEAGRGKKYKLVMVGRNSSDVEQ